MRKIFARVDISLAETPERSDVSYIYTFHTGYNQWLHVIPSPHDSRMPHVAVNNLLITALSQRGCMCRVECSFADYTEELGWTRYIHNSEKQRVFLLATTVYLLNYSFKHLYNYKEIEKKNIEWDQSISILIYNILKCLLFEMACITMKRALRRTISVAASSLLQTWWQTCYRLHCYSTAVLCTIIA